MHRDAFLLLYTYMVLCDFKEQIMCALLWKEHGYNILPRGPFCELFGLVENEPAGCLVIKRHLGVPGEVVGSVCISAQSPDVSGLSIMKVHQL